MSILSAVLPPRAAESVADAADVVALSAQETSASLNAAADTVSAYVTGTGNQLAGGVMGAMQDVGRAARSVADLADLIYYTIVIASTLYVSVEVARRVRRVIFSRS